MYFKNGQYNKSEATARSGLAVEPNNPWLENSLGVALLNQKKYGESVEHLEAALGIFKSMSAGEWGQAYTGNDPSLYPTGLKEAIKSIESNIALARKNF